MSHTKIAILVIALLLSLALVERASARVLLVTATGTHRIALTDEPCALKAVSNLPYRATWRDGATNYEGCYHLFAVVVQRAGQPEVQRWIASYFDDRTVAVIPLEVFSVPQEV